MKALYLSEDPADVTVRVTGFEWFQQQFCRQTLGGETGHSAAIVTIEHTIEETTVLRSDGEENIINVRLFCGLT